MAELERQFEREAQEALLDDAEARLYGERDNLAFEFLTEANGQLDAYGQRNDYATDNVVESGHVADTQRTQSGVSARVVWDHDAAGFFETGTSRHPVEGDPLAFEFDAAEYPGLAEMFPGGTAFLNSVVVSGLPAARYVRDTVEWFRQRLQ